MFIVGMCSPLISVSSQIEPASMDDSTQMTNHSLPKSGSGDLNENTNSVPILLYSRRVQNGTSDAITARKTRKMMYVLFF